MAWLVLLWAASLHAGGRPAPRLLLNSEDFSRIERAAQALPWAAAARAAIVQAASDWPATHNKRYGLSEWELPPEGGQWTLWYVCPTHGVSLQFRGPGQNVCPVDQRNYTGWPFDQVIYARRHSETVNAVRDSALAYRFTGNPQFAQAAARILLAYANAYASYPIHDINNKLNASSGGRATAQTLDEAIWLIPLAWAYDLIASSGALDDAQKAWIERDLLRAAAGVIARNDAKMSNWQSWHNAAFGAVGFALDDQALIGKAIDGPSGFRFQMQRSVFGDGVWYEGAWGYHFFALEPHCYLAEMAARAGLNLYAEPPLRRMFEAPLKFSMPDWTLPPFNDSGAVNLLSQDQLYEIAYARYRDPLFATVLGRRARGRNALFWGAETLPDAPAPPLTSAIFPDSGNALLRAAGSDHTLAFKFGPSGGWHGHFDKLNFVSYARGGAMAADPGTQSYAAKTHATWDKVTVAHNTVTVDEKSQAEADGVARGFVSLPGVSAARAAAGKAYASATLDRALLLTAEYALDVFAARSNDGAAHRFDWTYHNFGSVSIDLPLADYSAFPASEGYQHLSETRAAQTNGAWQANFDVNPTGPVNYGSVYTNNSAIRAAFEYSRDQAQSGSWSGRMSYDFSAAAGYALFSTPALAKLPAEAPSALSLWIYGDGSGHKLTLRINDATDERFVQPVGPVDWTGWREIAVADPAHWSHYLGNNDGVIDTPVKSVTVQLDAAAGGPRQGVLYVDQIVLEFPSAGRVVVADFERQLRSLRVWMLDAPETTAVLGQGLGPDLLKPVPFVMARRRAMETQFAALLEPYGEAPGVTGFQALEDGGFQITAGAFDDRVWFEDSGVLRFVRRREGVVRRLGLAGTAIEDGGQVLLRLDQPGSIQADFSPEGDTVDLTVEAGWRGEIRILAPAAGRITVNGVETAFRREEDYCVVPLFNRQG